MSNKPHPRPQSAAPPVSLFGPASQEPAPTWDETLKRVTTNVAAALLTIVTALSVCVAAVFLLVKLGMWAFF